MLIFSSIEFLKTLTSRLLGLILLLFATSGQSFAQLNVDLQLSRRQFISYEAVSVAVQLTNRTGGELLLHGDTRRSWLNVIVKDRKGNLVPPHRPLSFQAAKVPVGRSVAKQINLNSLFPITAQGKYTVYTIVTLPTGESFQSGSKTFDITQGRTLYSQRVGLGGKARDYRLISFAPGKASYLYFQAELISERRVVLTYPLGEFLRSHKPHATVDKAGRLNVLYLGAPDRYIHLLIDSRGKVSSRKIYKRGASGPPKLVAFANGEVQVASGIEFDPEKVRQQRAKIRKISERPSIFFD